MPKALIYTMGTSTHTKEEFLQFLRHYHIHTVVDVRSFPQSRFEHFNRVNLETALSKEGFHNIFLGKSLGGFRRGGYPAYTKTIAYQEGISHLERVGREHTTAFICAERFPWKCHRQYIATTLGEKGWDVVHIIEKDRVWRPKHRPCA